MSFGARLHNAISAFSNTFAIARNDVPSFERQLVEVNRRLDTLQRQLQAAAPLSGDEAAHLERYRMERRMLADWPGAARDELAARIRALLAKLRPMQAVGFKKARFGSRNDGGYVLLDDFRNIDTVLSFGVEHNAEFDLQMAGMGLSVRQFDHTIESAPAQHPSIRWEKKKIAAELTPQTRTISSLLSECDRGRAAPNVILKIDIEHDEWPVFDATPLQDLRRFAQITGEFHGFDYLALRERLEIVERVFDKLSQAFAVVHVHANNHCDVTHLLGFSIPYVLEFTLVNRALCELKDSDEVFPGPLDAPCDPNRPDIALGTFRF
ncbi:MAG: FkbM family methyltransferase [Pseudomonadota bacterium]|nr:FkbM family methyltransferase [Pseudomonadota bacterium]